MKNKIKYISRSELQKKVLAACKNHKAITIFKTYKGFRVLKGKQIPSGKFPKTIVFYYGGSGRIREIGIYKNNS